MTIDALVYSKALEATHVLPQPATKADLDIDVARLEHRLTLRVIGIVGAFNAALFALLRLVR